MLQNVCTIDLNELVYDGDRDVVNGLLSDPHFASLAEEVRAASPVFHVRKELLKSAMRLTSAIAPQVQAIADEAKAILGLKTEIEFFVNQDAEFNAACYPPDDKRVYIVLTSALLEKFSLEELRFVIGHEIGHYIFEHHRLPIQTLLDSGAEKLSAINAIKLYSWSRNAEISADRVGLLCCKNFEAAAKAFFKLSSGVTDSALTFNLSAYVDQFRDLKTEIENTEVDAEDWYSTHPFSPIRLKALDIFHRSETFAKLAGGGSSEIPESAMELEIKRFLSLMEPTYLLEDTDFHKNVRKFLFLAGYMVAAANKKIDDRELEALSTLLGPDAKLKSFDKLQATPPERLAERLRKQYEEFNLHLPLIAKLNIIKDLAVISAADGKFQKSERKVLADISAIMDINEEFVDMVIADMGAALD